ncbi:MAG UNVERIFIED_CONTAM: hypothetical protein LVR29_24910 [Microcystis novacekii LVE1205-3]
MNGGYRGCNPCIERHLAIFVNYFCLERTNQLSLLPDKDLVDLCSPIEPYQVTKNPKCLNLLTRKISSLLSRSLKNGN